MSTSPTTLLDGDEARRRLRQAFDLLAAEPPLHHLAAEAGPVELVEPGATPSDQEWMRCADLLAQPRWLTDIVVLTGQRRHTDDARIAGSLYLLGWSYWVLTLPLGCLLWAGIVPDASASHMAMGLRGGYTSRVAYPTPHVVDTGTGPWRHRPDLGHDHNETLRPALAFLVDTAIGGHLAPLIDTLHAHMDIPERLLWGNVASAAVRAVDTFAPWVRIPLRPVIDQLFDLWPRPFRELMATSGDDADSPRWRRTTCCLFYQVAQEGRRCDDCSLSVGAVAVYRTRYG